MNIIGYAKKYKNTSFRDLRITDVDALIFSELSYINFDLLLKEGKEEIRFGDITDEMLSNKAVFEGSVDAKPNRKLLAILIKTLRYQDVVVKYIENRFSQEEENQFYALTFVLPGGNLFVTYRGTDTTLIGWKEDFMMSVYDRVKAQVQAEKYIMKVTSMNPKKRFYLAGHSKGGNLAFYAALNLPEELTYHLIGAYSFDGPGFKSGIKNYSAYEEVKGRLIKFLTFNNVIGSVFSDVDRYRVVYSNGILGGHDPFGWQISNKTGRFRLARDVSLASKSLNNKFMLWIDSLSITDRMLTVEAFFRIFDNNITIYDLFKNLMKNLVTAKKSLEVYNEDDRNTLRTNIQSLFMIFFNEKKIRRTRKKEMKQTELKGNESQSVDE